MRWLGEGRLQINARNRPPRESTTQLVAPTGQGLGAVGRHFEVLLDAHLVRRRRAGRPVLYFRTAAGDVLVRAQGGG
jgi:DNA-binding transcriptional ArsR family regulator